MNDFWLMSTDLNHDKNVKLITTVMNCKKTVRGKLYKLTIFTINDLGYVN